MIRERHEIKQSEVEAYNPYVFHNHQKEKKNLYIDFPPFCNGRENLKRQVGVKNIERSQQSQLSVPTCNSAVFPWFLF